ncbi:TVP38/TMEM64 family protein [Modestobacter sp. I12A-02628]|uniref:TVP38/TMEM64 family membrane protein n=1 Tax=Goekera deserti TaxID=2497753 RepID=A0A7K3WJF7_9ACTN|nr:VTT domain-containing protein [Goekera deserti]MPR00552.1 TVP38/TMEM64 family protein [Goekera deserti]NDI50488.1 TVP38/TMEM64 family protein [Goekera deserti]NEL56584.1 TVP38/TMEM64 family protein [Goekera deserti]
MDVATGTATGRRVPPGTRRRAVALVVVVLAGVALALSVDLPAVSELRGWLAGAGPLGWVGLTLAAALVTLAPVPRSALSLLAGVLAGFGGGLVIALVSGMLGALAGFLLARALGRDAVTRLAGPRLARADAAIAAHGVLAVALGRLVPVTPFTLVNYAAGLSGTPLRSYLLGTAIGLVPGTVLQVALGASVGGGPVAGGTGGVVAVSAVLLGAAVAALVLARRRTRTRTVASTDI